MFCTCLNFLPTSPICQPHLQESHCSIEKLLRNDVLKHIRSQTESKKILSTPSKQDKGHHSQPKWIARATTYNNIAAQPTLGLMSVRHVKIGDVVISWWEHYLLLCCKRSWCYSCAMVCGMTSLQSLAPRPWQA